MVNAMLSEFAENMNRLSGVRAIMKDIEDTLKKSGGRNFNNLSAGNPVVLPEVKEMWKKHTIELAESDEFGEVVGRYGQSDGYEPFIRAVINLVKRSYNWEINEKNVLVTPGSQQFYFYILNSFAGETKKGKKKVLFPITPEYTGYSNLAIHGNTNKAFKPEIKELNKHEFKYLVNFNEVELDEEIGVIIFSRPCNPTGNLITDEEVKGLVKLAKEKDIPVVIDSAYGPPIPSLVYGEMKPVMDENVIHVMSLSKAGLPGERIGIAIGSEELISLALAEQNNVCLHSSKYGQAIAASALESEELEKISREVINPFYKKKRELAENTIKESFDDSIPSFIHKGEGTVFLWLWFKDLPIDDWHLYKEIKKENVIVVPGSPFFPGLENDKWKHKKECIRVSLTASDKDLKEGLKKVGKVVSKIYST